MAYGTGEVLQSNRCSEVKRYRVSAEVEKHPVVWGKHFECQSGCVTYICIDKRETRPFFRYPRGWGLAWT